MNAGKGSTDLLKQLVEFTSQLDGEFSDFFVTDTGARKLSVLVGEAYQEFFNVVVAHTSHSLVCQWAFEHGIAKDDLPIVWLDSEGWPNSVFAPDIESFISLLPYDAGFMYDVIASWLRYKKNPETTTLPTEKFSRDVLAKALEDANTRYDSYGDLLEWLETVDIQICNDPVGLIGKTMDSYPELSEWLGKG